MPQEPKLILTYLGSVVYQDKRGQLRHGPFLDVPHNVWLDKHGHIQAPSGRLDQILIAPTRKPDRFGLAAGDMFYSAERDGRITLTRKHVNTWEEFRLLTSEQINAWFSLPAAESLTIAAPSNPVFGSGVTLPTPLMRQPQSDVIPKNIHQILIQNGTAKQPLPPEIAGNIDVLKKLNPGWNYRLWSKQDIHDAIHDWYGYDLLEQYLQINPLYSAARADFFRYLCIYKLGGVYLDLKSGCAEPLEKIIRPEDQFLLSQWENGSGGYRGFGLHFELKHVPGGEYEQWHIIGAAGHGFIEQAILDVLQNIKYYNPLTHGVGKRGTLRVTGPIAYTLAVQRQLCNHSYRMINSHREGLIYKVVQNSVHWFTPHYSTLEENLILGL